MVSEICWLHSVLNDLHIIPTLPIQVFCDNISTTYLATNPVNHVRTKHLEVDLHFVRERVRWGDIFIRHISTHSQLADIFTKSLLSSTFCNLRNNLGITTHAQIEGG